MNNGVTVYLVPRNKYKIDFEEELSGTRIEENTIVIKQLNACVFASLSASFLMLTNIW